MVWLTCRKATAYSVATIVAAALAALVACTDSSAPDTNSIPNNPQQPADNTPPTVAITLPSAGTTTTDAQIVLAGTASDNVGVVRVRWVSNQGASGTAAGSTSWSATVPLQIGNNIITISADDAANNSGTATIAVTRTAAVSPPTQLAITTQPSPSATNGVPLTTQPIVQLRDAAGAAVPLAGVTVTAAIASGGGALGGAIAAITDNTGAARFADLSISGTVGGRTLSFTAGALTAATSASIDVGAGIAAALVVSTIGQQVAGTPFSVTVTIVDASGNPTNNTVTAGTITLTRQSGTGIVGGTTNGTIAVGASSIVISGVSYSVAETGVSLRATGTGTGSSANNKNGTSNTFTVLTAADVSPPTVAITSPTAAATFTTTANQIALGGTASDNVGVTSVTWTNDRGGSGTATGTTSWSVTAIPLQPGANVLTVTVTDASTNTSTATLTVTSTFTNPATQLTITTQPSSSAGSGVAFAQQPTIQLRDASGAAVAQAGVTVTAAIVTGGGALGGTTSLTTNASGVAAFTDLSISGTIGNRTLKFTSGALTSATSNAVNVVAGPAAKLIVATIGPQIAGAPFSVTVSIADASNNAVLNSGAVGTIALTRLTGTGTVGGTSSGTIAVGMGSVIISGVTYSIAESGVSLTATGTGSGSAVSGKMGQSNTFTVSPAPDTQAPSVAITTPAASGTFTTTATTVGMSGTASDNVGVTSMTWSNDRGGSGTASGTTSWSIASIAVQSGSNVITISARDAATNVAIAQLTIVSNPATQLGVATQPSSSAVNGLAFGTQPVIQLRDASGSVVAQAGVAVTAAIVTGGGTLGGTTTVSTNASGAAAFTDLSISGTIGNRTLRFTSGTLTPATSGTINVTAGPVAKLTVSTIATQTTNTVFSVTVGLYDANNNVATNTGATGTITLTRQAGTGTLGGTTSGSVAVGASSVTIAGVTYNTAESGVQVLATGSGASSSVNGKTASSNTFTVSAPGGCPSHNYTTTFPATEFPISEGGCWLNGKTDGMDWSDVYTTPGKVMGNQVAASYTDGTGLLKGTWGPDQDVSATVFTAGTAVDDNCYPEVELRLRSSIAPHSNLGYEIAHKVSSSAGAYLIIVRWNGALGDYTYVLNVSGAQYGVGNGDVVRATISGKIITVYKNGQVEATVDVTTVGPLITAGTPGVGFNLENGNGPQCPGKNSNYGFSRFSATDGTP